MCGGGGTALLLSKCHQKSLRRRSSLRRRRSRRRRRKSLRWAPILGSGPFWASGGVILLACFLLILPGYSVPACLPRTQGGLAGGCVWDYWRRDQLHTGTLVTATGRDNVLQISPLPCVTWNLFKAQLPIYLCPLTHLSRCLFYPYMVYSPEPPIQVPY